MFQTINLNQHLEELAQVGWTTFFIPDEISKKIQLMAKERLTQSQFRDAELAQAKKVVSQIRNDKICWLDSEDPSLTQIEKQILSDLQFLLNELKKFFRTSLTEYEAHYAYYEKGHFYQKHLDSTLINNKRIITFVLYLNDDWQETDAGDIVAYQGEKIVFKLKPERGRLLLFKSDIEHEVIPTNKERFSLTGWFRK